MMSPWLVEKRREMFRGKLFRCEEVESSSASAKKTGIFEVLHFAHWVNVIALTPEKNMILVRQWRHGNSLFTLEFPGGAVDRGEHSFETAAQRELLEETGYQARSIHLLGEVLPNPAFMTNKCTTFLALDCLRVADLALDPMEEIEVIEKPLHTLKELIQTPEMSHALIVAAAGLLMVKRPDLFV